MALWQALCSTSSIPQGLRECTLVAVASGHDMTVSDGSARETAHPRSRQPKHPPASAVGSGQLLIVVPDGRAIRKQQPLWKRLLMLPLVQANPFRLTVWQGLLDVPAEELATRIPRYVQTHAPPGWFEMDAEEDAERPAQP